MQAVIGVNMRDLHDSHITAFAAFGFNHVGFTVDMDELQTRL